MTDQSNPPKSGCFSTVVRRLLCAGSQQTHPTDNMPDPETFESYYDYQETKKEPKLPGNNDAEPDQLLEPSSSTITPNVVARLMGLNSIPETNWIGSERSPGSVTRSKSVNFMDYMLKIHEEEEEDEVKQCKRVKASVSFREVPCSKRNQQRHDFLLLYLDKLDEKREIGSKSRRFEKGLEDSKQKKGEKGKNKETNVENKKENKKVSKKFKDEPRKVCKRSKKRSDVRAKKVRRFLSPCRSKDTSLIGESGSDSVSNKIPAKQSPAAEVKLTRSWSKRFAGKIDEPESSSENSNSSPVSVLDRDLYEYLALDDYSFPGESETDQDVKPKTRSSTAKTKKKESNSKNNNDEETEYIAKLMNMLSELSEEDMKCSTWVSSSKVPTDFDEVEDFCVDFGQEILDLIVDQLVDELCI